MHRAGLAVDAVLLAHGFEHAVQRALADAGGLGVGQHDAVELRHHVAEHRALTATGGDDAVRRLGFDVAHTRVSAHRGGADVPVHRHRLDIGDVVDEALVAQVTQHQQFRALAQGHQSNQLALVDEDRERPFGRDVDAALIAVLVDDAYISQQLAACLRQARSARHERPVGVVRGLMNLG